MSSYFSCYYNYELFVKVFFPFGSHIPEMQYDCAFQLLPSLQEFQSMTNQNQMHCER